MRRIEARFSAVAVAVVSVGALAYGCSSSSAGGGSGNPEAGVQEAAPQEATGASSGSGTPDVFVPLGCPVPDGLSGWMPPAYVPAKHDPSACTAQDIVDYAAACITSQKAPLDCPVYRQNHVGCAGCLESQSADPTWGPLVFWPNGQTDFNRSGCLELLAGASASCPSKLQALDQCSHAACDVTCALAMTYYQGLCTNSAYTGPCMNYAMSSLCAAVDAGGSPEALCQVSGGTREALLLRFAPYFCGGGGGTPVPVDGGTTPPDSGSGGPRDASTGASDAPRDAPKG